MPTEIIGEFGTPGASQEWISAQATLAIQHIVKNCGPPPPETELEVQWQEHELGSYPVIVLAWEDAMRGAPWHYIAKCEDALVTYETGEAPQRWTLPALDSRDDPEAADDRDADLPQEPGDNAILFELQRYVSELIEYGLDASMRERHRPHPVEHENDDAS